ncbi:hypothetical protein [Desulforamulus aeronauticus]|uniref:Uncharacterized protein n=1 Tax=Desulforamulus aeronauticus DSM 10349 TaxID=1121421 RepID=A0A1M6PVQ4_9FIRM|nr:hypothetical protein [Desulforamulus aeronauticus]SHK11992.1 hypothetical protein SAMN02745123_00737 [Desulforamulus aeronauticus DSM 10349]
MKYRGLIVTVVLMSLLTVCATAFGYTKNSISEVVLIPNSAQSAELGIITIQEDDAYPTDLYDNDIFIVKLPAGVCFDQSKTSVEGAEYEFITSTRMEITIKNTTQSADEIKISPVIDILPGAVPGDVIAKIDARDSGVTACDMLIAKILP